MLDNLVIGIKEHEGFENHVYKDSLGFDTLGYGTKMPISKKEATVLLRMRLDDIINDLKKRQPIFNQMPEEARSILSNMAYQMGVTGLLKFKKTWEYLQEHEFKKASVEMLDSMWYKQTPERAKELSNRMKKII